MKKPPTVDDIIHEMGGPARAGKACECGASALRYWRALGYPPPKSWPVIVTLTAKSRAPISYGDLDAMFWRHNPKQRQQLRRMPK